MMLTRLQRCGLFAVLGLALTVAAPVRAQTAAKPENGSQLVVLELFTSQGCNSCPPADALMSEWKNQPGLLPLSLHVDYWDYLGWKDTLSRKGHGVRQQDYARNSGKREVYTPQVVVNGQFAVVGSDKDAVAYAISKARKQQSVAMKAERTKAGTWQVSVPNIDKAMVEKGWAGEAKLVLCRYDFQHDVTIERGENHGRTLNYLNVARMWAELGRWQGQAGIYDVPALTDIDWSRQGVVVLLQSVSAQGVGPIIGAVDLRAPQ